MQSNKRNQLIIGVLVAVGLAVGGYLLQTQENQDSKATEFKSLPQNNLNNLTGESVPDAVKQEAIAKTKEVRKKQEAALEATLEKLADPEIQALAEEAVENPDAIKKLISKLPEINYRGLSLSDLALSNYKKNRKLDFVFELQDQHGDPIPSAFVKVGYIKMGLGFTGSGDSDLLRSDDEGRFTVPDRAVTFTIKVSKHGYEIQQFDDSFVGKGKINLHKLAGKTDRVVIKGWKKTPPEKMYVGSGNYYYSPDGTQKVIPIPGLEGGLSILSTRDPNGMDYQPGEWGVSLWISNGGGIIETNDDFRYLAPEESYSLPWSVDFDKDQRIPPQYESSFYVRANNGRSYGILDMGFYPYVKGDKSFVSIHYWINPNGSRNLEPNKATSTVAKWKVYELD